MKLHYRISDMDLLILQRKVADIQKNSSLSKIKEDFDWNKKILDYGAETNF